MGAKPSPRKRATYQDVLDAPEHMVAEILNGELHLTPSLPLSCLEASSALGASLMSAYALGITGPGGWHFLRKFELHFGRGRNVDVVVPDIAAWTDHRFPQSAVDDDAQFISVAPDWVCEILSPSTTRLDRMKKVPLYWRERVARVWLVDPAARMIEVFRYSKAGYRLVGTYGGDDSISVEPFAGVELTPFWVWGRTATSAHSRSS